MNYDFMLWMLLYPLAESVIDYIDHLQGNKYSVDVKGVSSLLSICLYFFVGYLLY